MAKALLLAANVLPGRRTTMKKFLISAIALSVSLGGVAATPAAAQDYRGGYGYSDRDYREYRDDRRDYRRDRRHYRDNRRYAYRDNRRCGSGTTGTIIGAIAGGLLGGEIGRGSSYRGRSTTGTIIGAGVGALAGREIDGGNCRR
jgi:uncharacterized protein YcfJ